jgi:hypothetical protein
MVTFGKRVFFALGTVFERCLSLCFFNSLDTIFWVLPSFIKQSLADTDGDS